MSLCWPSLVHAGCRGPTLAFVYVGLRRFVDLHMSAVGGGSGGGRGRGRGRGV